MNQVLLEAAEGMQGCARTLKSRGAGVVRRCLLAGAVATAIAVSGCEAPTIKPRAFEYQEKLSSARHWQEIARYSARCLTSRVECEPDPPSGESARVDLDARCPEQWGEDGAVVAYSQGQGLAAGGGKVVAYLLD